MTIKGTRIGPTHKYLGHYCWDNDDPIGETPTLDYAKLKETTKKFLALLTAELVRSQKGDVNVE